MVECGIKPLQPFVVIYEHRVQESRASTGYPQPVGDIESVRSYVDGHDPFLPILGHARAPDSVLVTPGDSKRVSLLDRSDNDVAKRIIRCTSQAKLTGSLFLGRAILGKTFEHMRALR